MYRHDELVSREVLEIDKPKPKPKRKRVPRKGIRMMVGGNEIVVDVPVEEYLKSDLAVARAAEALRGKTFLDP